MKVSYKKLWVMLAEREMSKAELRKLAGIAPATFTKLRRNQEVALSVLLKIADVMNCDAGDMMTFVKDNDPSANEEVEAERSLKL
jgi:DNA-binding Xre family transcriptional regulator